MALFLVVSAARAATNGSWDSFSPATVAQGGTFTVSGWVTDSATSTNSNVQVQLKIDNNILAQYYVNGDAPVGYYGYSATKTTDSRPDIGGTYTNVCGWRINVNTSNIAPGAHTLTVWLGGGPSGWIQKTTSYVEGTGTLVVGTPPKVEWSTGGVQGGIAYTPSVLLAGERYTGQAKGTESTYPAQSLTSVSVWLDSGSGFNPFAFNGGGNGQSNYSDPNGPVGAAGLYRFRAQSGNSVGLNSGSIYHGLRVLPAASTSSSFGIYDGWANATNPGTTGAWQFRVDRLGLMEKGYASAADTSAAAQQPLAQQYSLLTPEEGWWNSGWGAWADPAGTFAIVGSDWTHAGVASGQPVSAERVFVATKRNAGNPAATFDYLFTSDLIKRRDGGNGNYGDGVLLEAYKISRQTSPATVSRIWSSLQARGASDASGDIPTGAVLFPVALAWGDEVVLRATAHTGDNSYDNITFKRRDSEASNFTVTDVGSGFTNTSLTPLGGTNSDTSQIAGAITSNRRVNLSAGTFLLTSAGAGPVGLIQLGSPTENVVLQGASGGGTVLKVSSPGIRDGQGFADLNSRRSLFYFGGTRNIVIKDLTIDVAPADLGYVQGTIDAVRAYNGTAGTEVDLAIDQGEGVPLTPANLTGPTNDYSFFDYWARANQAGGAGYAMVYSASAYNAFQSNSAGGLKPMPGLTAVMVSTGASDAPFYQSAWVQGDGRLSKVTVRFAYTPALSSAVGAKMVIVRRALGEQLVYLADCTGVTFQNVKIRNSYGLTIEAAGGYGLSLNGVKFERARPSQIIVAPGDGLHFHDGVSGPSVENCTFDGLGDDAINIYAATAGLSHGFMIRNNLFRNIRGRAALIQAGYGIFAENKVIDLTRWGINLANEDVANGSPIRDLQIRNNLFDRVADDTSHGGYSIHANGVNQATGGGTNILPNIVGNKFPSSPNPAVAVNGQLSGSIGVNTY